MIKKLISLLCIAALMQNMLIAQITDAEGALRTVTADSLDGWKKGATTFINISQVSLTNWAAGGQNTISVNGLFNGFANLTRGKMNWDNYLDIGYGLMKQGDAGVMKTDDKIDLISKLGYKAFKKWNYAALFNFRTQMDKGYSPDEVVISKFLAPAYILGALGLDYKPNDNFSAFIAPVTGKITIVNDQILADSGAFGVDPGEKMRAEFGGYVRMAYQKEIFKNVGFGTKIDLFSNYLHNPEKIDVNWETLITLKANEFLSASLATNLIYDDDIKFDTGEGEPESRVQFKEVIAIGLTFKF
jgi:hypothetical protein